MPWNGAPTIAPLLLPIADQTIWGLPMDIFNISLSWELESSSRDGAICKRLDHSGTAHELAFPSWSWAAWFSDSRAGGKVQWFEDLYVSHLVMPEISFFYECTDGTVKPLSEHRPDVTTIGQFYGGGGHHRRDRWKTHSRSSSIAPTVRIASHYVENGEFILKPASRL
jgi:hypothetical protein